MNRLLLILLFALDGRWIGHYTLGNRDVSVRIEGGQLMTPGRFLAGSEPEGTRVPIAMGEEGRFTSGPLAFDGAQSGNIIEGTVSDGAQHGTFKLERLADLDENALRRFVGPYAFDKRSFLDVFYLPDIRGLVAMEFPSGRVGPIEPVSATTFVRGPSLLRRYPPDARFTFSPDGVRVNGRSAKRVRYRTEEVGNGTITFPRGEGRHPAVVLIHGGGPQTREFEWVPAFFARLGVAVLAFDKRADWQSATFEDLADDVVANVDRLRKRAEIDPRRIGLYASSNGAWVAPLVALKRPIAFVIARSASGWTNRRNVAYEAETDVRAHGFGESEVAKLRALHERDMAVVAANGAGWNELRDAFERASAEPWFRFSRLPPKIMQWNDANRASIERYIRNEQQSPDPAKLWPRVGVPVLIQIGGADEYVPAAESARILRVALARNRDATVKVYPNGTHPLFESTGGRVPDYAPVTRFTPGYLTDLEAWIIRHAARAGR